MSPTIIQLRSETKALEHRSALTPTTAKKLIEAGYTVKVEKSPERIFEDREFEAIGATLVPEHSWIEAPQDHIIFGLKELRPEDTFALSHTHIHFGHCYKGQAGWDRYLSRFTNGGGLLYDLEFLTDDSGRRVSAFGYHAGYAGAAASLLAWSNQVVKPGTELGTLTSYENEAALTKDVQSSLSAAIPKNSGSAPRVLIIGALGRCGRGAIDACLNIGIPDANIVRWDMAETAGGGPFSEIVEADIFINCIYLTSKIPPFVTHESLARPGRNLRVICDVSCDPTNPNNPIPVYEECSTFTRPTLPVETKGDGPPLVQISIDHLPSLLPREASESFSAGLLPSLLSLKDRQHDGVWTRAEKLFQEKVAELPKHPSS